MAMPIADVGYPVRLTASGVISRADCQLLGFYVASTNVGTVAIKQGTASDGSGGTAIGGTITPAAGAYHPYKANCQGFVYATIGGTALDVTFFFATGN